MPSRKFKSEGPILYQRYAFGYCEWTQLDDTTPSDWDELGHIYGEGYLPYSGQPEDPRHLFYMARSLRVAVDRLALDKKRRYDHRQWEAYGLDRHLMTKEDFLHRHGPATGELARDWMLPRFGQAFLSPERYRYILAKPFLKQVLAWTLKGELVAFALVVIGTWGAHYWYVFYRNGGTIQSPPGHGYLIDFIYWARQEQLPYAYLGTSYGTKSRYKSRGIDGIEFWDGNAWCADRPRLDTLRKQDDAPHEGTA